MINLEKLANRLTEKVFATPEMDPIQKAKLEYGLSLVLGIMIELSLALLISVLLGTTRYLLALMLSALLLRILTGGGHCSSYDRCLLFTLAVFLPNSVLVRHLLGSLGGEAHLAMATVLFLAVSVFLIMRFVKPALAVLLFAVVSALVYSFATGRWQGLMLTTVWGMSLQAFMLTAPGRWLVKIADAGMSRIGIE